MKIILSCDPRYQDAARKQFTDAGLELDPRKAVMVAAPLTDAKDWGEAEWRYFDSSLSIALDEFVEGDLVYLDLEVKGWTFHDGIDPLVLSLFEKLMGMIREAFPDGTSIGIYGLPYNRHWKSHTTMNAIAGCQQVFTRCNPDWVGPSAYANYQSSGSPLSGHKTQGDFANRIHLTNSITRAVTNADIYPFYQPMLRGSPDTEYQPLTKQTTIDWWTAQYCSGVAGVVWWYATGSRGQFVESNGALIREQSPWIQEAIHKNTPGVS